MRTVGSSAVGVAIFGVAATACSSGKVALTTTSTIAAGTTSTIGASSTSTTPAPTTTATVVTTTGAPITDDVRSQRVDLGFVSAYVIERGDGLVVIDTGATGSAPAIRAALDAYGKSWADVGYVIATHKHGDHVGSLNDVLREASQADVFAGDLDVAAISSGRSITPLFDGDTVNSVRIVATPGHTPGHISILDPDIGLFSGDALNGAKGTVVGPNPKYTPDLETAFESVKKLATFSFEQVFFGHGEPVLSGASAAVQTLADTL